MLAALVWAALGGRRLVAVLAGLAVIGGALFSHARLAALDAGVLAHMHGRTLTASAVLLEPPRDRGFGRAAARARVTTGPAAGEQAVLHWRATAARGLGVGDIVAVTGTVRPLGFSDAYQRRRNAHATIEAFRVRATGQRGGLSGMLDGVRRRAEHGLDSGLRPPDAALLRGMVLGEDERLTRDVRDDFQRSGLAHILAVSGSNVMLLAILVLGACAFVGVPLRTRLLLAGAVIAIYVPLAGGGPSIQRAGVMGIAGLVAALAGRPASRWYALFLAAAVTLAINPRTDGEPGWQLSFAAVLALLVAAKPLKERFERRFPAPVAEAAALTVAATLGTAPLMALYFQQVSLASLPANLLAAPAIAPVMWLGSLAAAAAQISTTLAVPFSALNGPLLVYVQKLAHASAQAPMSVVGVHLSLPAILAAWVALAAATAALLKRWSRTLYGGPRRSLRWPVLAVIAAVGLTAAHVASAAPKRAPGELVVSFLDIGQGDATLIQLGRTSVLVDTGPPDGPILARLREAGVKRLDALMTTHAEADHEGAAPQIVAAFHPRLIVDGGSGWPSRVQRFYAHHHVLAPKAGEQIAVGGLSFTVLWPPPRPPGWTAQGNPNDSALVTRMEANGLSMLLTADAESPVLAPLQPQPVDVLKVSHHGSVDPGLPQLLTVLHPRIAAIEVGLHNTYGHPAPSTIAALRHAVPTIVRTDLEGTVRLHDLKGHIWLTRS